MSRRLNPIVIDLLASTDSAWAYQQIVGSRVRKLVLLVYATVLIACQVLLCPVQGGQPNGLQAPLTVDNSQQPILNAFAPRNSNADQDVDCKVGMVELYENETMLTMDQSGCVIAPTPADPDPANGFGNVPIDTDLSWNVTLNQNGWLGKAGCTADDLDEYGNLNPAGDVPAGVILPLGMGDVIHSIECPARGPSWLAWKDGRLFIACPSTNLVYELNPSDGKVLSTIGPFSAVGGLTWDGANFWAAEPVYDTIYKFDIGGTILGTFAAPGSGPVGITWDGFSLWVCDWETDMIYQVNPDDGSVQSSIPAPDSYVAGMAFDGTALWTNGRNTRTTYRISRADGSVLASFPTPPDSQAKGVGITFDGQYLWDADYDSLMIYQIDIEAATDCPTTYDVYLGADPGAMELICEDISETTCGPSPLDECTEYYWQVIARNPAGQTPGPIWSFTTGGCICDTPPLPCDPDPADGAKNVPIDLDCLTWQMGGFVVAADSGELIGVDMDAYAGSPANWNTMLVNGTSSISLTNLIREDGSGSPVSLTLATPDGVIENYSADVNASTIPIHTPSLIHIDDYFWNNTPQLWTFTFSNLVPEAAYNVYVFGLRRFDLSNDVTIIGGLPPIHFIQNDLTGGNLWVNGECGSSTRELESFAEVMTATGNGELIVEVNNVVANSSQTISGIAIEPADDVSHSCPTTYDVYFGTQPDALDLICGDISETTCDPGLLDECTRYYWQVIAENLLGQTPGPVWSFSVEHTKPCITSWHNCVYHGPSVGELLCRMEDGYVEPRFRNATRLVISFDRTMNTSQVDPGMISIEGVDNGILPETWTISWDDSYCMTVGLNEALPDQDSYTITVSDELESASGCVLGGDREICLTILKGDANGNRMVNAQDFLKIGAYIGEPVDCRTARYDINCNGFINSQDFLKVRQYIRNTASPCP